jgi:hypothetical protein
VSKPLRALGSELWVLTHPDLRHTARIRALMTYIYDSLSEQRDLFSGIGEF